MPSSTTDTNTPHADQGHDLAARQASLEDAARVVRRLAHDFGNILTGILGFSELSLSLLSPNSPAYQYTTELHQAARQGADFTQALRWFSKRGTSKGESSSLADAVKHEVSRLRQVGVEVVELHCTLADDLPPVAVESEALRQVLRQVLENARDAVSGRGSISLDAQARKLTEADCGLLYGDAWPGLFVELVIADSGGGFTAEAQNRLFAEPFFSTKPRSRGFGLAVVYGILRGHQGGLTLGNDASGGARVRLYFPVAATTAGSPRAPRSALPRSADRVLVVDDDPMVLQLVCATLEQAGYRVQAAAGGAEALSSYAAAGGDGFHLVLSDVVMPRISGIDLARQLLGLDAAVNVLFMSGQMTADFAQAEFLPARFDLLSKPFRPEGLLRAVRAALDRRLPRSPASAVGSGLDLHSTSS